MATVSACLLCMILIFKFPMCDSYVETKIESGTQYINVTSISAFTFKSQDNCYIKAYEKDIEGRDILFITDKR